MPATATRTKTRETVFVEQTMTACRIIGDASMLDDLPIPPAIAQSLARRWLLARFTDLQREETLAAERAAQEARMEQVAARQTTPEYRARAEQIRQDSERRLEELAEQNRRRMSEIIETYRREVITEWTAQLLESVLVLPDGTRTTWGQATVDQHRARLLMYRDQAASAVEGASRHANAIEALEAAQVPCLNDLVKD